ADSVNRHTDNPGMRDVAPVGRDVEHQTARTMLRGLARGEGGALLITGEAGMGKSQLARAVTAEAEAEGWSALIGHPDPILGERSFGILIDALGPAPTPGREVATDGHPIDLFVAGDSYLELVQRRCRDTPLVLVTEDLHWADDASLATLTRRVRLAGQL